MDISDKIAARYRKAVALGRRPTQVAIAPDTVDAISTARGYPKGQITMLCGCHVQLQSEMHFGVGVFF